MNRIETKIVIMVTNRLAAAKDSDAKMELIEELSENLYQRYQDLVADGVSEEEALKQTMDSLGDVKELLAYLKEENKARENGGYADFTEDTDENRKDADTDKNSKGADMVNDAADREDNQKEQIDWKEQMKRMGKEIEASVKATLAPNIKAMEKELEKTFGSREMEKAFEKKFDVEIRADLKAMADSIKNDTNTESEGLKYDEQETGKESHFPSEQTGLANINTDEIHTIKMELRRGNIEVNVMEALSVIDICTESDDLDISEPEKGVLVIRQKKARDAGFLSRMMEKSIEVELGLPAKFWERIELRSPSGDITVNPYLKCRELEIVTSSGDMELWEVQAQNARLQTVSGDITAEIAGEKLYVNSVSGDVEINNTRNLTAEMHSISGDVTVNAACREAVQVSTTSGDSELNLECMPESVKISTVSGDCTVVVPQDQGFELQYKTTSGDFSSGNMMFNGIMKGKSGKLTYLDGGNSEVSMNSVSGDLEIHAR